MAADRPWTGHLHPVAHMLGAPEQRSELPLCFCEEIVLCLLVGQESRVSPGAEFTATDLGVTRLSHEKQAGRSDEPK